MIIFIFFYTIITSFFILNILKNLAKKIDHLEMNYRGNMIPIGSGLLIPILMIFIIPFLEQWGLFERWLNYCIITYSLGIVGFIDDRLGNKEIKGLKGHLNYLISKRRMSTGLIKLILIFALGTYISIQLKNQVITVILCTLVFALWTNIFNLLDVRPGRAIKGFWLITFVIFSIHINDIDNLEWILLLLTIFLFVVDVFELGMLGDAGSNLLGGIVGFWMILFSTKAELIIYLLVGILLNLYAEKRSFSVWIEKHPMIRRIDHWGRKIMD